MVKKRYKEKEVYPNSPLIEVICELTFPGEMSIECNKDRYYELIKDQYPNILVPNVKLEKAIALEPYRFEDESKTTGIMLSMNKFAYYSRKYEGHEKFIKEFLRLQKTLFSTYCIDKLSRIGWRYINIIEFTREDGHIPLNRFFELNIALPGKMISNFEHLKLIFNTKVGGGAISTKLEVLKQRDTGQDAFLLDFDFALADELSPSSVKEYIHDAHLVARGIFEDTITDDYRQFLRGEEI